ALTASTHEFTFSMAPKSLPSWINMGFEQKFIIERAYQLNKTRYGGGLVMRRVARWTGKLKPTMEGYMSILGYNNHGVIRNKSLALSIEPVDFMTLSGKVKYQSRMPTFMEMYAKNRFFIGNPGLDDEGLWDLELATDFRIGDHTRIHLNGFMGFISDMIVYVPFAGTQLRPINTGVARRYGVDLGFSSEPWSFLMVESKNSILSSKIKDTNAPLPQTPSFLGLTRIRFGIEDFLSLTLQSRYRGPATANIYGTLRTNPYALFDAILAARLFQRLGLSLSISNIFNVKSARDTYEMPLPGTIFFGQIEVGNV
ncbi:MAG TPA: TonB-dependent receptor, partial [Myxococcota bacterium]|nr:TonB-dependent receptor [Myxococcota bacterium]